MTGIIARAAKRLNLAVGLTLLLLFLPLSVQAQDWGFHAEEDSAVFRGSLFAQNRPGFSLSCTVHKSGTISVYSPFFETTIFTRPDELYFTFNRYEIGQPAAPLLRNDVVLVIGASAFRLPGVEWDEYMGDWGTILQATGPMFDAIAASQSFEIRSNAGTVLVDSAGFAAGYASLINSCRRKFAVARKPWRPGPAITAPPVSMRQAAEAAVAKGCNGPSAFEPDAFLTGLIDGDDLPDVVLDWRKIKCTGQALNPFCGASMCSADVYLSSIFGRSNTPDMMLALGVRLQPLSNGKMAVGVGGSLSDCYAIGTDSCEFLFYWNGSDFVNLP